MPKKKSPRTTIEELRNHLLQVALQYGDLLHPEVIRASQELDKHIVQSVREQVRLAKSFRPQAVSNGSELRGKSH